MASTLKDKIIQYLEQEDMSNILVSYKNNIVTFEVDLGKIGLQVNETKLKEITDESIN